MEERMFYLVNYEFEGKPEFIKILDFINGEDDFDEEEIHPGSWELDFESTSTFHRENILSALRKKHPVESVLVSDIQLDITEEEYQTYIKVKSFLSTVTYYAYSAPPPSTDSWEEAIEKYKQNYQRNINYKNWINKLKINNVQYSREYFPRKSKARF